MIPGIVAQGAGGSAGPSLPTPLFAVYFDTDPPVDVISSAVGTLVGDAVVDTTNQWIELDGGGDYVWFDGAVADGDVTTEWTVEAHITPQGSAQNGGIVTRVSGAAADAWILWSEVSRRLQFYAFAYDGFAGPAFNTPNGTLPVDVESHVALVREGTTWRAYIGGVQQSTFTWSGAPGAGTAHINIGNEAVFGSGRDFQGLIGRVKMTGSCLYPGGTTFTPPSRLDP